MKLRIPEYLTYWDIIVISIPIFSFMAAFVVYHITGFSMLEWIISLFA